MLRAGTGYAGRLAGVAPDAEPAAWNPDGLVLITGGTGGLGAALARHLVERHGVRHLLLVGRRGECAAELVRTGRRRHGRRLRRVRPRRRRRAAARVLDRPLTAVVHAAGVLDDGVLTSLTPERLDAVLRPKADAAWTSTSSPATSTSPRSCMFSSVVGTAGRRRPGQLRGRERLPRRARRPPARARTAGALAGLGSVVGRGRWADARPDRHRHAAHGPGAGCGRSTRPHGLRLFDAALATGAPAVVAALLDLPASGSRRGAAVLRGLVRPRGAPAGERRGESTVRTGHGLRHAAALDLVRGAAAAVLGHDSADRIDAGPGVQRLGFDSLTAVELRNRLQRGDRAAAARDAGLRLPDAVRRLAGYLLDELPAARAGRPRRSSAASSAADEPIAIVGMGCRFPGGVSLAGGPVAAGARRRRRDRRPSRPTAAGTWTACTTRTPTTPARYVHRGRLPPRRRASSTPDFFGISPREALAMDPQQRLLLETVLGGARARGHRPDVAARQPDRRVRRRRCTSDYAARLRRPRRGRRGLSCCTGSSASVVSGRVVYTFGLEGPAVTVDTACSSSLVALHLAGAGAAARRVLAGAGRRRHRDVHARRRSSSSAGSAGWRADGRCKSFAAAADGTGWAEGVGVLLLERLSDARAQRAPGARGGARLARSTRTVRRTG